MQKDPNRKKKQLFHSLGTRILIISLILLVLPLLVHNIFMYREDFNEKKETAFLAIRLVGEDKAYDVQQYIGSEQKFLRWISTEPITKELLERAQNEEVLSTLSYHSLEGESFHFFKDEIPIEKIANSLEKNEAFVYQTDVVKTLLIPVSVKRKGKTIGYLISETSLNELRSSLFKQFSFPYTLNILFFENDQDPYPDNMGLEPFPIVWKGEKYFAKRVSFKGTNFSVFFFVLEEDIKELSISNMIINILQLLVFFFLIGGIFVLLLTKRMSRPIKHLLNVMEEISGHDLNARYQPDKMGFEINILGLHFNNMIDSIVHYQEEVERIHVKKEALRKELEIGRDIQQSLFPKQLPTIQNVDIASYCEQAKEVGGDFYDLFVTENRLIFSIADVSGKGISACLYSLGVRSLIRSALSKENDLKKAMQTVNHLFHQDVGEIGVFTTLWVGSLDLTTKELTYTSLGHHPALLKRKNEVIELTTQSNAIGPFKEVFIETATITLQKDDLIFLYTDGVIDRQNTEKEFYGYENIKSFVLNQKAKDTNDLISSFIKELDLFAKAEPLYDDLTLVSICQK